MAVDTKPSSRVAELCRALKGKKYVPLREMPKEVADPSILADALSSGFAMIGRQSHSTVIDEAKVVKKQGRTVFDEVGRPVMEKTCRTILDGNDWSWTDLNGPNRKTLQEVLDEESDLDKGVPPLHVKLTTKGLAMA